MNNSGISANQTEFVVKMFCSLAEDIDVHNSINEYAFKYIKRIWNTDQALASCAIEKIICDFGNRPRITNEIALSIAEISDKKYDDLCFKISNRRSTHDLARISLFSCLLFRGHEETISRIDDNVRRACQSFLKNKIESIDLLEIIRQACILGRKNLYRDISSMILLLREKKVNSPYIHISERRVIEVIADGMNLGESYLKNIIRDNKSQVYEKEAAVFSLGCEKNASFHSYFNEIFSELYQKPQNTTACNEIVGAILYSSYDHDVIHFLTDRLKQLRTDRQMTGGFLFLRDRHKMCVSRRLLFACECYPCCDACLIDELKLWLVNKNDDVQVFAVLALEKQGIKCDEHEKKLKSKLKSQRAFRKNYFTYTDLAMLRQYNLHNTEVN
jgi:hypothetical protein